MVHNCAVRFEMRLGFFWCGSHWPFTDQNPALDLFRQTQSDQKQQVFFWKPSLFLAEPWKIRFSQTRLLELWIFLHILAGCHISVFLGCHGKSAESFHCLPSWATLAQPLPTRSKHAVLRLFFSCWFGFHALVEERTGFWSDCERSRIQTFISQSISLEQTNQLRALYKFTLPLDISQQPSCSLWRRALQLTQIPLCFLNRLQRDIYFGCNSIFLLLLLWDSTFPEITSERCWGSGV